MDDGSQVSGATIEPMRRKFRGGSVRNRRVEIDFSPILKRIEAAAVGASVELTDANPGVLWNDLYQELCEHPLMRRPVGRRAGDQYIGLFVGNNHPFFVDEDGVLRAQELSVTAREREWIRKQTQKEQKLANAFPKETLNAFLEKRLVGKVHGKLYWFVPVVHDVPRCSGVDTQTGHPLLWNERKTTFRQDKALSDEERKSFLALPRLTREEILGRAPTRGSWAHIPIKE